MLNVSLIEQFQMISQEQRGGAVEVTLGERKVRFGFENGELSLLDMGEEKELAMARKLLDYHKIGPEIHRHAVAMARATGGSIVDTLRRQQLVSESEVDQVAQSMIEDLLSLVFGIGTAQMTYRAQESLDSFDLDKRAVRLKIDIPTLLDSVQARVAEEEAVIAELGGWNSPIALDEGGDADQLDDFERHILTQVDGKKTVEQIAIAFRDSNFNIGRMLVGMMRKGFIKRGGMSGMRAASTTVASVAAAVDADQAAAAQQEPSRRASEFEVYRPAEKPPGNSAFRLVLGTVLAVLLGISIFVVMAGAKQGQVSGRLGEIEAQIDRSAWAEARSSLDEAQAQTGNDLGTVRQVTRLNKKLDDALTAESEHIDKLIEDYDFTASGERLERFPDSHPRANELRLRRIERMKDFESRTGVLTRQVLDRLERRDVVGAFATLDKVRTAEADPAYKAIDRWRLTTIELARRSSLSLGERQALVNLVQTAKPTSYQAEQLQLLQDELNRGQNRRQEQVRSLAKQVSRGAWQEAQAEVDKEHLLDQAPGSALLAEVTRLVERIAVVRKELDAVPQACNEALAAASDPEAVVRARKRLTAAIATYPDASNLAELKALDQVLSQLEPVVGRGSTADEATALGGLLADQPADSALVKAARSRITTLRNAGSDAEEAIESARSLGREGKWNDCIAALTRIGSRPEWKRTPTGLIVADEIALAQANKLRLETLTKQFRAKLDSGDVAGAYDLSRQMGLRYLPLLVESMPPGATVLRDGKDVGRTPLVIEISAGERLELLLELRAPGCLPLTLNGAQATGGWRLTGALRRKPLATTQLKSTLTAQPAAGDGRLWVAGASGAAAIDAAGTVSAFPYADASGAGAPKEPVYAPAAVLEDGIYIATRERFALRIAGQTASRVPLAAGTDGALVSYRSTVILDRRFLFCAGLDGSVHAGDPAKAGAGWRSTPGAPFAGPLVVVDDLVLAVRRDGELIALQIDRGDLLAQQALGAPVVAAWATPTGLAGITANTSWTWDGRELLQQPLPRANAAAGAPGLLVTRERQVLVFDGTDWKAAGQCPAELTTAPILWNGHPVLVSGRTAYVLGLGGFQVDATAPFLSPVVVGDNLALATSEGDISFFAP